MWLNEIGDTIAIVVIDKKNIGLNNIGIRVVTRYFMWQKSNKHFLFINTSFTSAWHIADANVNKSRRVRGKSYVILGNQLSRYI